MKSFGKILCLCLGCTALVVPAHAQNNTIKLNLQQAIEMANDSSLSALKNRNQFLASYWAYRSYKAERLPSLTLELTPARYYRNITQRYDSNTDQDVFRAQQTYSASGGLSVKQNFDWLGGTFYLNSDLEYLRNFGETKSTQFSSVPLQLGYSQDLLGYNPFKWDKLIEPLKYETAQKQFIYNMETVSESVITYFFALAMAQAEYKLAKENVASSDTLYKIGMERFKIAAISKADLLTLQLDNINALNALENAKMDTKRAMFSLANYLKMNKNAEIELELPGLPMRMEIPLDKALAMARENNPSMLSQRQNVLEAQETVDRTKMESRFNASFNASIGFNQVADKFKGAYRNLLQQDLVSVSISVPLVDWGVRKGKYNMAKNNLNVVQLTAEEERQSIEEDVIMTVNDFNVQRNLIASAEEALRLAEMAYEQTRERFIIGKADVNSLTLALNRQQSAQNNYISSLRNYWQSYYKIRRLTLYDFASGLSLYSKLKFDYVRF